MSFIARALKRCFEGPFEVLTFGLTILALSIPGIIMIFVRNDVFSTTAYFSLLRGAAIAWAATTFVIGSALVFWGARSYASPGTVVYYITHPRLFPR